MFNPVPLNLPSYPFRIKTEGDTVYIFDELRKKFIVLTPEEWVRQHIIQYLISHKHYPRTLISIEGGLKLNGLTKRSDLLVYNHAGGKILLVECKAPTVKISQDTFHQIARYNRIHQVTLLLVSNGLQHFCCTIHLENGSYQFINELPDYKKIEQVL